MYSKKLIGTIGTSVLASAFLLEKNFIIVQITELSVEKKLLSKLLIKF